MTRVTALIVCCVLAACSRSRGDALNTADALRSSTSATGAASTDPVCRLYSSDDAAHYIGEPAKDGELSMGGCQWMAEQGQGNMMVQVVPVRYNEKPEGSRGYRVLSGVGSDAFVSTSMDGWLAGAVVGKKAVRASVAGKDASETTAIALLKETIKRLGQAQ